ncbi:exodeoxyribonuclease V subunit beta [Vibrio sp. JC009]|uniref:exodeoxyribonuclease V subunit beta n=1 Tax=Vibrio sp. JC009 TaxID=2912314 RepID=UPI0023AF977E|nr:exodeoxyribonuclease V subunit beta [Vibrio sp. JC009]WED21246.1 exodeoxyribonuclease V subunit beta [Vibrio sp. JC009]
MAQTLDTMTFPLHGARLIEASAGTGKTFTIAGLYLRLLLGHGTEESRHQKPLTVDQILVVTFTEAATAELRDRIRSRIHDARIAFMRGVSSDPVIKPLLEDIEDHPWAARTLLDAERQMDEASVYTIHGFCQRMLTQNAFESGSRFNNEFVTDESKLKSLVVSDYWRKNFYSLSHMLAAQIRDYWSSPKTLLKEISGYLTGNPLQLTVTPMSGSLENLHQANLDRIDKLKREWQECQDDIAGIISASDVSKRSFTKKNLPAWIALISEWAASETVNYNYPEQLEKFSADFLREKTAEGKKLPEHEVFHSINQFISEKPSLKEPVLAHAIQNCREMLEQAKQQKRWLSFDDLLTQLSSAIDLDEEGMLAGRICELYPVAMIDEFQDTDPMQYSIFGRVYLNNPETGLFMIGDPKQAIYGFRGADIFTYIKARNEVSDHYTLGTNWRSSACMVAAVNEIFKFSDSPFLYDSDIPFLPVTHSPDAGKRHWVLNRKKQSALTFWIEDSEDPVSKGDYLDSMSQATANQIHAMLEMSKQGLAQYVDGKNRKHHIQAGDIAVLVRTGSEGAMIKQALSKKGVASVYLSNRDSVYASPAATDIRRILTAVLNPEDESALRAVLASDLFFMDSRELDKLNQDENLLEDIIGEFSEYRKLWLMRGVMPMLRSVMSKRHIAENLLTEEAGERLLTDYLHLAELLQQASLETDSHHGLLRWFSEQIEEAHSGEKGVGDEEIQRLESEKNLVQIVTIHKSKGLEYEFVFLPFASTYREAGTARYFDEEKHQTILDITKSKPALALADKERLAEDLRLLYVALTRAVYGCFVGIAPVRKGMKRSNPSGAHLGAIGHLIQNGEEAEAAKLATELARKTGGLRDVLNIADLPAPYDSDTQMSLFADEALERKELSANRLTREIDRSWWITSYSGLVKQGHSTQDSGLEIAGLDVDSLDDMPETEPEEPARSIFTFPKGARPGTFLHTLFEEVDFTLPAGSEKNREIIEKLLEKEQYDADWQEVLEELVDTVLSTPLDGKDLCLNQKDEKSRLVEMEFMLPITALSSPQLNQIAQQYDALSEKAGDLGFHTASGMLKGFIDLVFEHQGRYYVLDWKSNYLGDDVTDYHKEALNQAMIDHRYDLQYQIYALALHRFLKSRIADYSYEQHFGGVYYLFLRGIDKRSSPESGSGIFSARPEKAMLEALDSLIDGQEVAHA